MTDLVKRLRTCKLDGELFYAAQLMNDAADRIEQLEAELSGYRARDERAEAWLQLQRRRWKEILARDEAQ